jgi:hypothetical protein
MEAENTFKENISYMTCWRLNKEDDESTLLELWM